MFQLAFHPAVTAWLEGRFGRPTEVQAQAWAVTSQRGHALIAAPTGSGKTLAAFLSAIDELVREGLAGGLADEVHVLYVSPLKALSNDIRKNLQEPLAGIRERAGRDGPARPGIRAAVRTGDTPAAERERMRRTPPHILVTTPESLYILLSSDSGRAMLKSVKSVIVDELHAVAGSKRGSHLMLSLERLAALCERAPVRIGLSATVKPLEEMARFLIGQREQKVAIIDAGHVRDRDLAIEVPRSPLTAVMPTEVWDEMYDRLAELVAQHRTTLIFVNQRRIAERVARHLAERLGEAHVTAHHGSLAREHRLQAEQRLKQGELKALVATSSLELGIDIGDIDLVCQLGSPRSVNAFLQRVGRAGHAIGAVPKGRLFPLALDDLLECTALLDAVARGELDRIRVPDKPLDALAQHIVAETACREWQLDALYDCCPARAALSRPHAARVRAGRADAGGRLQHPARPARRLPALRRRQPRAAGAPRRAAGRRHQCGRDPRPVRLRRGAAAGGAPRGHPQRGLRLREPARRHLPARQCVVPHRQGGDRQGDGGGREGAAAHDAVLARREPGPQRRAVRGGVADLRDGGHAFSTTACRPANAGCATACTCRRRRRSSSRCTWRRPKPRSACCPAGSASCSNASSTRWATRTW